MADYTRQRDNAYASIARKGAKITFDKPPTDEAPADPDAPWEGSDTPGEPFEHIAVILPLAVDKRTVEQSNHRALIPAKGLPFELRVDVEFRDAIGRLFSITALGELAPDPTQLILYDVECALWPTAS